VNAVDIFAKGEFTGNVVSFSGCQCGPWLSAKYHHVRQDAYEEHDVDSGSVRTDPVTYHFIDTTVGLNLEKEILQNDSPTEVTKLTIRAGWNCQPLRKRYNYNIYVDGIPAEKAYDDEKFGARNSLILSAHISHRLSHSWTVAGSWTGKFSKDTRNNSVSLGAEYSF
jgi:uncharacterized protein with beta-barrel porin domain